MPDRDAVDERKARLRAELHRELTERLLPYWMEHARDPAGGFVGRITQEGVVVPDAARGAVLNARILWTFAAAAHVLGDDAYRRVADEAYAYFDRHFWDGDFEGVYWSLDRTGRPLSRRKQIYAQAFALYALAEYYRASEDRPALARAIRLFELIEAHAYDPEHGGYFEAYAQDWSALDDVRLSDKDLNAPKSMNTLLHVLEAYTNLYRIWPDACLRARLGALVDRFVSTVLDPETRHLRLFFDASWTPLSGVVSYGHDIEASWLLAEAAQVLEASALAACVREVALAVATVTMAEGLDGDGGLFNEAHADGRIDTDKHWWPQAEALVGFLHAYRESGDEAFFDAAERVWNFTKTFVFDRKGGEWFGRLSRAGVPYRGEDKVGLWKCPYHNARACLEGIARLKEGGS